MIEIHEIAARNIQAGDRLAEDGVAGLDHWYDTNEAGQDVTVTEVQAEGDYLYITVDDQDMPIETQPDLRVTVIRTR